MKVVVLHSGGLDSSVCLAMACAEHGSKNVISLSLSYGQKHAVELECAKDLCEALRVGKHIKLEFPNIFTGYGSTLVDADKPNPKMTYEEIQNTCGVSPTYVPFRNANLLSAATTIALVEGAELIYYGAHSEDAKNWAYPDCTPEFNGAMANAIWVGSYGKVRLITPLQWMEKSDIVRTGIKLRIPFELTWSCYNGGKKSCGECPTCVGRIEAFKKNGLVDPVPYAIPIEWMPY
jgi:7-cyano-7-deazaguanine synthase